MPATKTKAIPSTNGTSTKGKAVSTSGTTTPVSIAEKKDTSDASGFLVGGKPDKKLHDAEQDRLKADIDALQVKAAAVREKISLATKSGSGNDRRSVLRAELDNIRGQQLNNKNSRGKIHDQLKALQDGIQKKIKDLQAAKSKTPFKNIAEIDAHVKHLEKQVESGNMKLADEKRALQEISTSKRNRRLVETFESDQQSIDADRRTEDELRKQLADPEFQAISQRYDEIKAELDELKKESDEAYAGRTKLFEERDSIQSQLNALFSQKRESVQSFREANDRYWNKVNEDRARRAERARTQRAAEEAEKKREIAERLREEAEVPAFQAQIEDCQTLIDYFSGKNSGNVTFKSAPLSARPDVAGVPKLEIRKVEATPEGSVVRKKKGEEEDAYFIGNKTKGKNKRGAPKTPNGGESIPPNPSATNTQLNVPLPTLSALLSLSIPPPASTNDVPRVIEDLKTKRAWFEANQARVTAENVAKAENEIQRLINVTQNTPSDGTTAIGTVSSQEGGKEPAESAPASQADDVPIIATGNLDAVEKLALTQEEDKVVSEES